MGVGLELFHGNRTTVVQWRFNVGETDNPGRLLDLFLGRRDLDVLEEGFEEGNKVGLVIHGLSRLSWLHIIMIWYCLGLISTGSCYSIFIIGTVPVRSLKRTEKGARSTTKGGWVA